MTYVILILSVLLGSLLVLFLKPNKKFIRLLLAFSGAYLLSVTILHLLPEVYNPTSNDTINGILIISGILFQYILESFSKGAEHGHIHLHSDNKQFPIFIFLSLCIHAFSEGLPIHHADHNLLWAIAIHKIPIAIVLTSFLIHAKYSKKAIFTFMLVFALMSPLGALLADEISFFQNYISEITALIAGTFLHISTIILFESTENHKFNLQKFIAIMLGVLITFLSL